MLTRVSLASIILASALCATQGLSALAQSCQALPLEGDSAVGAQCGSRRDPLICDVPPVTSFIQPVQVQAPPFDSLATKLMVNPDLFPALQTSINSKSCLLRVGQEPPSFKYRDKDSNRGTCGLPSLRSCRSDISDIWQMPGWDDPRVPISCGNLRLNVGIRTGGLATTGHLADLLPELGRADKKRMVWILRGWKGLPGMVTTERMRIDSCFRPALFSLDATAVQTKSQLPLPLKVLENF
jgi:hypothetical protein